MQNNIINSIVPYNETGTISVKTSEQRLNVFICCSDVILVM